MDYGPQASISIGFLRNEYWSELPFPPPGDLPDAGVEPGSPTLLADSVPSEPPGNFVAKIVWFHLMTLPEMSNL